jgi:glucosamine-6-phosphate deaminase
MITTFEVDRLTIKVFADRNAMGTAASLEAGSRIKQLLKIKNFINIIFAAAPSQNEFLAGLLADEKIEWNRVNAFHMDEYLGLEADAPQLFGNFLKRAIFSHRPFHSIRYLNGQAKNIKEESDRYAALLAENPPDIVCMGIGENTHLAFNDPGDADFNDPVRVKRVPLDLICRQQQVNDGCFQSLNQVPEYALTLTIPALMQAPYIFCMVPGKTKSAAILHTLMEKVSAEYPSTILRNHSSAILYLDEDSYSRFKSTHR